MKTLTGELNIKIEDYNTIPKLGKTVREYFELLRDYMIREKMTSFVHTRRFF